MASDKIRVTVPRRATTPRGAQWAANFVVWLWRWGRDAQAVAKRHP
jgi:hypothetical protein